MDESVITRANFKGSRKIGALSERGGVPGKSRAAASAGNHRGLSETQRAEENPVNPTGSRVSGLCCLICLFFKASIFFFYGLPSRKAIFKLFTNSENIWDLYQFLLFLFSIILFCFLPSSLKFICFALRPVPHDNINNNERMKRGHIYSPRWWDTLSATVFLWLVSRLGDALESAGELRNVSKPGWCPVTMK